jgi:hypothetical protein
MKVNVALYFFRGSIVAPQVCCSCLSTSVAGHDEILCLDLEHPYMHSYRFRFPYCYRCYEDIARSRLFKDRARAVAVSNMKKKGYGSLLGRKTLKYVEFSFKNNGYGQLFREANRGLLLENVLTELQIKK